MGCIDKMWGLLEDDVHYEGTVYMETRCEGVLITITPQWLAARKPLADVTAWASA